MSSLAFRLTGYYSYSSSIKEVNDSQLILQEKASPVFKIIMLVGGLLWLWLLYTMITKPQVFDNPPPTFAFYVVGAFAAFFLLIPVMANRYVITTFDKSSRKIHMKFNSAFNKKSYVDLSFDDMVKIELGFYIQTSSSGKSRTIHYFADLILAPEGKIRFSDYLSKSFALKDAKVLSDFLGLPINDEVESRLIASGEMDQGIKVKAQKFLASASTLMQPENITEEESLGILEISYYKRKFAGGIYWFFSIGFWFVVSFIAMFVAIFNWGTDGQWTIAWTFLGAVSAAVFYFIFIWLFYKVTYTFSREQIVRTKKAPLWNRTKTIDANSILEINQDCLSLEDGDFELSDDSDLGKYLIWRMSRYYGK